MSKEMQLRNCFIYTVYGDAVGFLRENHLEYRGQFIPFQFERDQGLVLSLEPGQWSDLTEQLLILTKCLIDQRENSRVSVDYRRLREELRLWQYYRHGRAENLLRKISGGKEYYKSSYYWNDKRGYGFSRIIVLFLANNNFEAAKEEVFKQIVYTNRHPQVLLTALLLLRTLYLLLTKAYQLEDLTEELKTYLMELKGKELESMVDQALPSKYSIEFEREKINYLLALDRLNSKQTEITPVSGEEDARRVFLEALTLYDGLISEIRHSEENSSSKEALALAYGLWGLSKASQGPSISQIKNYAFIDTMGAYLFKLRNYQVNRTPYAVQEKKIDLFQLEEGTILKHPILNVTRVAERVEDTAWLRVRLETKGLQYNLYKKK